MRRQRCESFVDAFYYDRILKGKPVRLKKTLAGLVATGIMVAGTAICSVGAYAAENYNKVTYTLAKVANPNDDQKDAYNRITKAMDAATARWNKWNSEHPSDSIAMHLNVNYRPGVPTAQANPKYALNQNGWKGWGPGFEGTIDFGSNRSYMVEGTALHEIGHNMSSGYFQ